jgi:hypothetical protein
VARLRAASDGWVCVRGLAAMQTGGAEQVPSSFRKPHRILRAENA